MASLFPSPPSWGQVSPEAATGREKGKEEKSQAGRGGKREEGKKKGGRTGEEGVGRGRSLRVRIKAISAPQAPASQTCRLPLLYEVILPLNPSDALVGAEPALPRV